MTIVTSGPGEDKAALETLRRRYDAARAKRGQWESLWQDAYKYALPQRQGFGSAQQPGENRMERLYDGTALDALDTAAVSYQIVLTKADKPSAEELQQVIAATKASIAKRPAAHPHVILTSSVKGDGLRELRTEIAMLLVS